MRVTVARGPWRAGVAGPPGGAAPAPGDGGLAAGGAARLAGAALAADAVWLGVADDEAYLSLDDDAETVEGCRP
jgi:hypothetical protein